jgi:hypothetical protein
MLLKMTLPRIDQQAVSVAYTSSCNDRTSRLGFGFEDKESILPEDARLYGADMVELC